MKMDELKKIAHVKNGKAYKSQFPSTNQCVTAFDALKDDPQRMDSGFVGTNHNILW